MPPNALGGAAAPTKGLQSPGDAVTESSSSANFSFCLQKLLKAWKDPRAEVWDAG